MISCEARDAIEKAQLDPSNQLVDFLADSTPLSVVERYVALPSLAKEADYGEFDRNVVVLDTETTGFSLNHDELTQIAAARLEKGEIVDWFITFVNPGKPIPEEVAHLTDIHDEDVASAPSPAEALAGLVEFVGDAKIVAHNADFDRSFTTKHPAGYPLLENLWLDSLDLARIALPRMKSHRLIDLVKAFGAPLSTHRADDDVAATCALYRILLAAVDSMPKALVSKIASFASVDQWPTSAVFSYFSEQAEPATPFSIRSLRRERLGRSTPRAKVDAEQLAVDPQRGISFPMQEEVADAFSGRGLVGELYEDYEPRDEQLSMALAVRDAFSSSCHLVVEAGTGVGKSMAYLVPAALTACRNDISVGVATKTNALLDQLVNHELPVLADELSRRGVNLTYAPLKGFANYLCLRRVERLASDDVKTRVVGGKECSQAPALAALLSFVEQTDYDDMSSLKMDYRLLPRYAVTTTSHDCLRRKCPFYGTSCFVHGARRRAEAANIIVTNHSMLFCDLAADGGLMPPVRYWVVDEAHGAELEARRAFSFELSAEKLKLLAARASGDDSSRSVFAHIARFAGKLDGSVSAVSASDSANFAGGEELQDATVVDSNAAPDGSRELEASFVSGGATLLHALLSKARVAGGSFSSAALELVPRMRDLLAFDDSKRAKGYESVELWLNDVTRSSECFGEIARSARAMSVYAEKLVTACQELVGYLEGIDGAADVQRETASLAVELKDVIAAVETIFSDCSDVSERYVRSAVLSKRGDKPIDKLEAMPYSVGSILNEKLYARAHSVVFASATLTVGDSFDSFKVAMGLDSGDSPCETLKLASSYDFDRQMRVYVAEDMPEPNDPRYLSELQRLLAEVHLAQGGSALTLFTNRKEMEKCFEEVQPVLKAADLRLVCQKWGVSVKGLRDDFLADEHLSLFALKSFWEGFDAPGATLKAVVIPKLPFAKPTDPLSCERSARDDQAWRKYVLPAAVLETKQAAGRLIRKADDEGVLVLADKRLVTKSYGRSFLNSLPSRNVRVCSIAEIAADVRAFSESSGSHASSASGERSA